VVFCFKTIPYGNAKGEISLLAMSPTPFCEACRVLLAEGVDPATKVQMWHWGDTGTLALTSTVGHAAARTVIDSGGPPAFSRYVDVGEAFRDAA
jgi:hypothetical protein